MNGSVRVLPLLVVAGLCLFALKSLGLLLSGGYVISGVAPASAQNPESEAASAGKAGDGIVPGETQAQSRANAPGNDGGPQPAGADTQQTAAKGEGAAGAAPPGNGGTAAQQEADGMEPSAGATKSELAVLEGLANRRKALDQREREIDLRENMLKAAEKRVEARIDELKAIQGRIEGELEKRDDHREAQYERLVGMYSKMKPKDAARIFNRLEPDVLTALVSQMKPRIMSAILAEMDPAAAQRLTLEIASQGKPAQQQTATPLPQIESQPAD